jgi:hypothetical protein
MNLLSIGIKWWHEVGVMVDCWECWYWAADFAHTTLFFLHKRNPIVAADTLMHSLIRHKTVAAARPYFTEPYHHL